MLESEGDPNPESPGRNRGIARDSRFTRGEAFHFEIGTWLDEMVASEQMTDRRRATIRRIVNLFEEVAAVFQPDSMNRELLFGHLNRAGQTLTMQSTTLPANVLCDLVETTINERKDKHSTQMATGMLFFGILIQA